MFAPLRDSLDWGWIVHGSGLVSGSDWGLEKETAKMSEECMEQSQKRRGEPKEPIHVKLELLAVPRRLLVLKVHEIRIELEAKKWETDPTDPG